MYILEKPVCIGCSDLIVASRRKRRPDQSRWTQSERQGELDHMDQPIFDFLRAEVDHAREKYTRAKEQFWKIASDTPSGLPHPDGTQRVGNAARAQTAAMLNYTKALRRFNAFLLDGTVPEELLPEKNAQGKSVANEGKSTSKVGS
jgi:hypothetical protein